MCGYSDAQVSALNKKRD